jgi:hypothetical protein
MLDDLRDDADFMEDDDQEFESHESNNNKSAQSQFLGMTPSQRLVIAIMILLSVCILGFFFLLITESVILPL